MRAIRLVAAPAVLMTVLLAASACGSDGEDVDSVDDTVGPAGPVKLADIDGTTFATAGADALDSPDHTLVDGSTVSLTFKGDELSAHAGCNHLMGTAAIVDDNLEVDALGGTEMGCDEALMEQDQWLADFLTSSPTISMTSGTELTLASGEQVLVLTAQPGKGPDDTGDPEDVVSNPS